MRAYAGNPFRTPREARQGAPRSPGPTGEAARRLAEDLLAGASGPGPKPRRGLSALGLKEGEVLAILGHNAPEWVEAELAAQVLGALPMGIYADAMPEEVGYFLEFTGARGIVVSDEEQLDKVYPHLHLVDFVLVWEEAGMSRHFRGKVRRFSQAFGDPKVGEEALRRRRPEETALLAPTSGTTGRSKLAMLSHQNLLAGHEAVGKALGFQRGAWVFSYLPFPGSGSRC